MSFEGERHLPEKGNRKTNSHEEGESERASQRADVEISEENGL